MKRQYVIPNSVQVEIYPGELIAGTGENNVQPVWPIPDNYGSTGGGSKDETDEFDVKADNGWMEW